MANIEQGEVFTITDNGREQEVEIIGVLSLEGTEYAAVSFVEDLEEQTGRDLDVFFLKTDGRRRPGRPPFRRRIRKSFCRFQPGAGRGRCPTTWRPGLKNRKGQGKMF